MSFNMNDQTLIQLLKQLEAGYMAPETFNEVARVIVTTTVVLQPVIVDDSGDSKRILLTQRADSDKQYPSMWHPPGTVLRPTDQSISSAIDRLVKNELPTAKFESDPVFTDFVFENILRGKEVALLYKVVLQTVGDEGKLFDLDKLPENIVPTDIGRIKKVGVGEIAKMSI